MTKEEYREYVNTCVEDETSYFYAINYLFSVMEQIQIMEKTKKDENMIMANDLREHLDSIPMYEKTLKAINKLIKDGSAKIQDLKKHCYDNFCIYHRDDIIERFEKRLAMKGL